MCLLPLRDNKWFDYSGKGNHGAVEGATKVSTGRHGFAWYFDGLDDYINCGDDESLPSETAFTIEAWTRVAELNQGWSAITDRYKSGYSSTLSLYLSATDEFSFTTGNGVWHDLKTGTVNALQWYCVVGVWDETNKHIYLDGDHVNEGTPGATEKPCAGAGDLWIGQRNSVAAPIKGDIGGVRLFNRALAKDEIKALYEQGC